MIAGGAARRLLPVLVLVQAGIGLYQHQVFFAQLFGFRSRLPLRHAPGAGSSLYLIGALVGLAVLWAGALPAARPAGERVGAAGLANIAALGLSQYAAAMLSQGRLRPALVWPFVALSGAVAFFVLARRRHAPRARGLPVSPWDGPSVFFLLTLLVPALFPYIHFDAKAVWACRAYRFDALGDLRGVLECKLPNYPPLFSILLWLGIGDPLFEGRLLPWLAIVFFALFFRARLAALVGGGAPMALLFLLATVHVWQGAAMYYANVPLMAFLCAGALLAWGLPGGDAAFSEKAAGALCLSAAVLIRPDGFIYLGVLAAACAVVRQREARRLAIAPFLVAAAAFATWGFRPSPLRLAHDFFSAASGGWREAGLLATLGTFANGLQGQWLAHKGFGTAFFLLAAALVVRVRGKRSGGETGLYGLVTLGSLAAVALCYLAIPFVGDAYEAAQPYTGTWLGAYLHFIRVGLGRMTVHLYPFAVMYGAAAFAEAGERAAVAAEPAAVAS